VQAFLTEEPDWTDDLLFEHFLGVSSLGACLELAFDVRTGRDVIEALPSNSKEKLHLQILLADGKTASLWTKVFSDIQLIVGAIVMACGIWLVSFRRISLKAAVAVSSISWTALIISQNMIYTVCSFVVMLWEAQGLAVILKFAILQFWLISVLPAATGIGKFRWWLAGNATYAVMQCAGYLLALVIL